MRFLTRKLYNARTRGRLFVLLSLVLISFCVFQLANDDVSLELPRGLTENGFLVGADDETSKSKLATAEACFTYFQSLSHQRSSWNLEGFGDKRSFLFSKRRVIQSVRSLRLYGHCFVTNQELIDGVRYEDIESRLFPTFTRELPIFTRWDGTVRNEFPLLNKHYEIQPEGSSISHKQKIPFWRQVKNSMNNRGIVISLGESGVTEVKRLLNTLRLLGNKLPIQLVHKGDVSAEAMRSIVDVGRRLSTQNTNTAAHEFDTPQDVWFVDAKRCIESKDHVLFKRFSNKWIASLFNSFEEMILMDSDAVPFINPETLFDSDEYREAGALFFKDRLIDEHIKTSDLNFYRKLLPSDEECRAFGIPPSTEKTMNNDFIKSGYKHLMESGVVVIKRSNHLPGLLISTAMQLWKVTNKVVYGDKEFFWLGQSISGNENYQFNKNAAGALGTLKRKENKATNYTCSTQLAHFDENLRLLWINGGLMNCKKPSWFFDLRKQKSLRLKFESAAELETYFIAPVQVDGAILPTRSKRSFFQKIIGQNAGFKKCPKMGCDGSFWCAFVDLKNQKGKTITFTSSEIKEIDQVIRAWNSELK
ncbi:LAQU0S37e00210g1_1 [Lachancea quebecensis]|uniref:LAQU0S37e00210g1_1 n=1 Tax=Lachancea quebecensis TaxID=1654605 RepID=A0A0P1KY03_9SACH|nr:LAQU0S37e00210g1_1 [Lachancea quebecensis]